MNPLIIGEVVSAVGSIADDLFTSDEERAKADLEAMQIGLDAARVDAGWLGWGSGAGVPIYRLSRSCVGLVADAGPRRGADGTPATSHPRH